MSDHRRIALACRLTATAVIAATLSIAPARAQQKLGARSFFPTAYQGEIWVDVAGLQDCGVWDTIERSPARMLLEKFRRTLGFDLADLERMTAASKITPTEEGGVTVERVFVLEGRESVGLEHADLAALSCEQVEIGGHRVLEDGRVTYVSPAPGLLVTGSIDLIESILRGKAQGGVAHAELLPLIAGRKPLAHLAYLNPPELDGTGHDLAIPAEWMRAEDRMTHIKLALAQDEDNGRFGLTLVARFANGEAGPAAVRAGIEDALARAAEMPELIAVKSLLGAVTIREQDKDLVVSVDLGPRGKAIGPISQLLALSLMVSGAGPEPPVGAVEAGPVLQDAEVEQGAAAKGKGKGKN